MAMIGVLTASVSFSATGSDSPLPAVRTWTEGTPCCVRYAAAAAARRSERRWLYASSPCASVCPTTMMSVSGYFE